MPGWVRRPTPTRTGTLASTSTPEVTRPGCSGQRQASGARSRRPPSRLPGRPAGDGRRSGGDRRRRHPHVPIASYRRAFALLNKADVVLRPALDGGYYPVAAKAARPELLVGVPMGTEGVLTETMARATRAGLVVDLLPPLRDLDRVEDLAAALAAGELAGTPATLAATRELLAAARVATA